MGEFAERLIQKISELKGIQKEPAPSFVEDPAAGTAYIQRQVDADYRLNAIGKGLVGILRQLPAEQKLLFYATNTSQEQQKVFVPDQYMHSGTNAPESFPQSISSPDFRICSPRSLPE